MVHTIFMPTIEQREQGTFNDGEFRICGYCGASLVGIGDKHATEIVGATADDASVCFTCWSENHTDRDDCAHDDDACPWFYARTS